MATVCGKNNSVIQPRLRSGYAKSRPNGKQPESGPFESNTMSTRQYILDENVNPILKTALQRQWPDMLVWRIGDPGTSPKGTPDPDILQWCEAKGFSLVTNNRTSMPVHLTEHLTEGRHIPGIFILRRKMSTQETVAELALIWLAAKPSQYADLINFIPVIG